MKVKYHPLPAFWDSSRITVCILLIKMSCSKSYTAWRTGETTERRREEKAWPSCYCSCLPIKKTGKRFPSLTAITAISTVSNTWIMRCQLKKKPKPACLQRPFYSWRMYVTRGKERLHHLRYMTLAGHAAACWSDFRDKHVTSAENWWQPELSFLWFILPSHFVLLVPTCFVDRDSTHLLISLARTDKNIFKVSDWTGPTIP